MKKQIRVEIEVDDENPEYCSIKCNSISPDDYDINVCYAFGKEIEFDGKHYIRCAECLQNEIKE